jgi:TatD DNase family protein
MLLSQTLILVLSYSLDLGDIADYDRLHHSPADTQRQHLPYLLSLAEKYGLPMFLHSRHPDAHKDLVKVFKAAGWEKGAQQMRGRTGVVHSFTGSREEMEELVSQDLSSRSWLCKLRANRLLSWR